MKKSLGKQFSLHLSNGDFNAAIGVIKQARSLNYPNALINYWENSLSKLEPGFRHPLDYAQDSNTNNNKLSLKLGPNLRKEFRNHIYKYCTENNIGIDIINRVVDITFANLDLIDGKIVVPDLTANNPTKNLLHYSAYQYSIENPDVSEAVKKGIIPSEIDHFLRCGYIEILYGKRYCSTCFSHEREKYTGKLLYIVDDYKKLDEKESNILKSPQLDKLMGDILSLKDNTVYTSSGSSLDIEAYLFQNISEYHNICILLPNKTLAPAANKWIIDICSMFN